MFKEIIKKDKITKNTLLMYKKGIKKKKKKVDWGKVISYKIEKWIGWLL